MDGLGRETTADEDMCKWFYICSCNDWGGGGARTKGWNHFCWKLSFLFPSPCTSSADRHPRYFVQVQVPTLMKETSRPHLHWAMADGWYLGAKAWNSTMLLVQMWVAFVFCATHSDRIPITKGIDLMLQTQDFNRSCNYCSTSYALVLLLCIVGIRRTLFSPLIHLCVRRRMKDEMYRKEQTGPLRVCLSEESVWLTRILWRF